MSQQQLVSKVADVARRNGKATTLALAAEWCVSERTARYWINELERAGQVRRIGRRCGWLPMAS